jgi:hypothetical protein
MGSRYTTITQNDGDLAEGNFPLTITGDAEYQVKEAMGRIFILSEDTLYEYSTVGNLEKSWEHRLSNTSLCTSDNRVCIYEEGSTKFQVYDKNSLVYSDETDTPILFAKFSKDGKLAVISESDTYAGCVTVYDTEGKLIYTRNCVDKIFDFVFNEKGTGAVITFIKTSSGTLAYSMISVAFDSEINKWENKTKEAMPIETFEDTEGNIYAVTDKSCDIYSPEGGDIQSYAYNSKLVEYDFLGERLALLLSDEARRTMKVVVFSGASDPPLELEFGNNLKTVKLYEDGIFLMTTEGISEYDIDGKVTAEVKLEDMYSDFLKIDRHIFLLGYGQIDRIDFKK